MKFLITLILTLVVVTPSNLLAYAVTETWANSSSPGIYSRATTTDGYTMNHKYMAKVTLTSPDRTVSNQVFTITGGGANATVYLPLLKTDLGKYYGNGYHSVDCPYNYYDWTGYTAAAVVEAGTSYICYVYVPNSCRIYNNKYYADYRRIDSAVATIPCSTKCTDSLLITAVEQPANYQACLERRPRYIYWVWTLLGGYKCYQESNGGRWWGTEYCTKCEEKRVG